MLTKEAIINVFKENKAMHAIQGVVIDVIPKDDWNKVAEQILLLIHNDTPPQLNKQDVSGWQEFEKQLPNAGDEIIIISPVTNEKSIIKYRVQPKDELFWKGWRWHLMPV
jgi:hypothetical protein